MTIPNVPRFNVPETFGRALSYEGQIHAILGWYDENADAVNSAVEGIESAITDANAAATNANAATANAETATANANTATANAETATANANTATANAETATANANTATANAETATANANTATANANSAAAAARTAAASYTDEPMTTTRLMYPGTSTPGDYLKAESDGEPITSGGCMIMPLYGPSGTIGDDYIGLHFILTGTPSSSDGATLTVPLSEYVGFGLHDQLPNSMRMHLEKTSDISVAPPANADVDALPSFRLRSTSSTSYLFDLTPGTDEAVFDIEQDYGELFAVFKCHYGTVYYTVFRIVLEFDPPIQSNYELATQVSMLQDYSDQIHLNNYEYGVSFRNDWIVHPSGTYTSNGLTARYAPTDEENKGRPVIWVIGTMTDTSTDAVFDFIPENVALLGGTRYGILNHTYSSDLYVKVIGRYTDGLITTDDELTGWVEPESLVWFEVPNQDYTEFGFSIMRSAAAGEISEYTSPLIEIVKSNVELEEMINDVQAGVIIDGNITTPKIANGAVTTSKIANGAVTTSEIANAVRTGYVRSFETVADMQAATDLLDGMTCHTEGFHASGDGGAAYYAVGTTGTANGMDVLACQGGLKAVLTFDSSKEIRISQLGAIGDGNNDTASISRAFAIVPSGGTINIDVHNSVVTQKLTLNANNVNIVSDMKENNYVKFSGIDGFCIEINSHGCNVIGVNFMNNDATTILDVTSNQKCIRVVDLTTTVFYNIDFECMNCTFIYFANAITTYGKNANIHNCTFSNCINGVVFDDNYNNMGTTPQRRGLIVRNCTFHGSDFSLIRGYDITTIDDLPCFGVINTYSSRETIIDGNNFNSDYYGYMYKGAAEGLIISNNTGEFYTTQLGICYLKHGTGEPVTRPIIRDNAIGTHANMAEVGLPVQHPIVFDSLTSVVIVMNNSIICYSSFITCINCDVFATGNNVLLANYDQSIGLFNLLSATSNKVIKAVGNLFDGGTGSTSLVKSDTGYSFALNSDYSTLNYQNTIHITNPA